VGPKGTLQLYSNPISTIILIIFFLLSTLTGGSPGQSSPPTGGSPASPPAKGAPQNPNGPLKGRTIVIDPGHGGQDPGAVGYSGKTYEKYNVLWIALDLRQMLEEAGAKVIMTRSSDVYLTLASRVNLANRSGADIYISIHNDANRNTGIHGTTTYFYTWQSQKLGQDIQRELVGILGSRDVGVRRQPFYVIRYTQMPSVLVEVGFMTHPSEEKLLVDPAYRVKAARGIYNGILRYFRG
jgi:N-acetylmuramoyl-L-alanine amidase